MIDWLGPIVHEYYGATEGHGLAMCDSEQWLTHKGTAGKPVYGEIHILNRGVAKFRPGPLGKFWIKSANRFAYFHDPKKMAKANSLDGR